MTNEENYTETSSASAGEPQRLNSESVRARAEVPNLLSQEVLDQRQANIGDKRRTGGLPLVEESTNLQPPDVPATDCQDLTD